MRWITIALIAILLFVGSGAGVAYASEDALPGDALYSAKTTIEGVRLAFSDSDGDVELYNEFANTRVAEMQALAAAGRSEDMPAAAQGYENALNGMAKAMAEVASDSAARAEAHAALLEATHETRTAKLNELLGTVPEQAQQGIQRALDAGGPPDETGKRPEGKGKPENAGCPDNAGGPPDGKGKPEDVGGPPEDAGGPPEDAGPPEDSNAPDGAGPSDENGPPDDKGKPEDAGGPPDDKGKPDDCPSENRPEGGGGEGDETEEVEVEEEEEDED